MKASCSVAVAADAAAAAAAAGQMANAHTQHRGWIENNPPTPADILTADVF